MGRPAAVATIILGLAALSAASLRAAVVVPPAPGLQPSPSLAAPGAEGGLGAPGVNPISPAPIDIAPTSNNPADPGPALPPGEPGEPGEPENPVPVAAPLTGELDLHLDALTEVEFGHGPDADSPGRGDAVVREFAVEAVVVPEPVFLITPLALAGIWACRRRRR